MNVKEPAMALQKILLVDDDQSFIGLNRAMLKYSEVNCQIDECRNGKEALAYIQNAEQCPDVILLDIDMPVMDGFEFLEQFEQQDLNDDQPMVFMVSSSLTDQNINRTRKYPFVKGFFEKPLTAANIEEILSKF